ncbi:MAG: hypothetical protein IJY39_11600 [Clostridia bacterium]|nr:hypothetical protein [Clostridia bacterium]
MARAEKDPYAKETIRKKRKFPVENTVWLIICICIQAALIVFAVLYTPQPKDVINFYTVEVEPLEDGSLDITYSFEWTALDKSEALTWVEIGVPNENFLIYPDSVSDSVAQAEKYAEDGYCSVVLDFKKGYIGGETVEFSFKINQRQMLCKRDGEYFYEYVPGWFNNIRVENYIFKWKTDETVVSSNADSNEGRYAVWSGSLDYGGYETIQVTYADTAFEGVDLIKYSPFDGAGANNGLESDKFLAVMVCVIFALILTPVEFYIFDSYVSYGRGRGFIRGYGHHIHVYGGVNPRYRSASREAAASRTVHTGARGGGFGGSGGRGCACACACACAGGGRAGCSQKDTYGKRFKAKK